MNQLTLFDRPTARQRRDDGMKRAERHAGNAWSEAAYGYLMRFIACIPPDRRFMTEQVRQFAYHHGLSAPPSERAWGAVTIRAVKDGKIVQCGFGKVSNDKAHCANAAIWRKV